MNNVIIGPWGTAKRQQVSEEAARNLLIQELVANLSGDLFDELSEAGFDVDNSNELEYTKDIAIMAECIRSYLLKQHGAYHPIQDVASEMFEWVDNEKLRTVEQINIRFKGQVEPF